MRKLTLEQRISRLERLLKLEKKAFICDINKTKDLITHLLDDGKANSDNLALKDLEPKTVSNSKYGKAINVKRVNGINFAVKKWQKAIGTWYADNKGYKVIILPNDDTMDIAVYTEKDVDECVRRRRKDENAQLSSFDCVRLNNLIKTLMRKTTDEDCFVDVDDTNAVYGMINVSVECANVSADYEVEAKDSNRFSIARDGISLGNATSLDEVSRRIANDISDEIE